MTPPPELVIDWIEIRAVGDHRSGEIKLHCDDNN